MTASKILEDEHLWPKHTAQSFGLRIGMKKKSLASHRNLRSKSSWETFKKLEKYGILRFRSLLPFHECLSYVCKSITDNVSGGLKISKDCIEKINCDLQAVLNARQEDLITGLPKDLHRLDANIEAFKNLSINFSQMREGIVFNRSLYGTNRTLKITGQFTPVNKIFGVFTYGSLRIDQRS